MFIPAAAPKFGMAPKRARLSSGEESEGESRPLGKKRARTSSLAEWEGERDALVKQSVGSSVVTTGHPSRITMLELPREVMGMILKHFVRDFPEDALNNLNAFRATGRSMNALVTTGPLGRFHNVLSNLMRDIMKIANNNHPHSEPVLTLLPSLPTQARINTLMAESNMEQMFKIFCELEVEPWLSSEPKSEKSERIERICVGEGRKADMFAMQALIAFSV